MVAIGRCDRGIHGGCRLGVGLFLLFLGFGLGCDVEWVAAVVFALWCSLFLWWWGWWWVGG